MGLDGFGRVWKGLGERLSLSPGIHLSPCHFFHYFSYIFSGFPPERCKKVYIKTNKNDGETDAVDPQTAATTAPPPRPHGPRAAAAGLT